MNSQTPADTMGAEKKMNRRKVIKIAVATAPIIATLPSGAALARSSNVIGDTNVGGAFDSHGRTLCLDLRSGTVGSTGTSIDLGVPPRGSLTAIKPRNYRTAANGGAPAIDESEMCKKGGTSYYLDSGWKQVNVPKGMLVSATALSSFAGSIYTTEI